MAKLLPHTCPGCNAQLKVKSLYCDQCETEVSGSFTLPALASLSSREQDFIIAFVKCSGSLKIMARELGLSYPTVRNLLDDIIDKVKAVTDNTNNSDK